MTESNNDQGQQPQGDQNAGSAPPPSSPPPTAASAQPAPTKAPETKAVDPAVKERRLKNIKAKVQQIKDDNRPLAELLPVREQIADYIKQLKPAARVSSDQDLIERVARHEAELEYLNEVLK